MLSTIAVSAYSCTACQLVVIGDGRSVRLSDLHRLLSSMKSRLAATNKAVIVFLTAGRVAKMQQALSVLRRKCSLHNIALLQ